jgi:asparagine synthase (glutamine-hydrolysing)
VGFAPDPARIDIVAHRGPDGRGWRVFESPAGPVALGHRRLAIIDTSDAGLQPMADVSGRFHMVFNGEIYNYLELRDELRRQGEVFTTESDSEVLLRAYMVWKEGCLARLRGMFAFLIFDDREKRLFAARDRYGIKPLYLFQGPRGLALASEIKQLLGLPGLSGRMNVARVHDFLASGISDHTAETMFDGVLQIRGGESITIDAGTATPQAVIKRWYPLDVGDLTLSEGEAAERFGELLRESVRLHLRSDVPVGSCLSGGLDSSAIVCLMSEMLGSRNGGSKVNTISACYAEKSVDEKPFMDDVVAYARTEPHFVFPRADDVFQRASDITWHQDEPFGSTSIFAQWCVFEEAHRVGLKVMLDGQGADEQLAGYHGSFFYYLSDLARRGRIAMLLRTMMERRRYHGVDMRQQLHSYLAPVLPSPLKRLLRPASPLAHPQRDWLGTELIRASGNPEGALSLASASQGLPQVTDLRTLCITLTFASNLQMLLHWEDRNSMAHSIEARVPFLDHPLVEFDLALGNDHKIVGGDTKRVLRKGMRGVLPESVRERRDKLGFATPEEVWFRGPLRELIADGVEATLGRYPELMRADETRALMKDMLENGRPVDFTLWRIVNLGIWGERLGVSL